MRLYHSNWLNMREFVVKKPQKHWSIRDYFMLFLSVYAVLGFMLWWI